MIKYSRKSISHLL